MQSGKKGARLLIENKLAENLLSNKKKWLTIDGYNYDIKHTNVTFNQIDSIISRICPTEDNDGYELLYFWSLMRSAGPEELDYKDLIDEFYENFKMYKDKIADHYKATIYLLRCCQFRQNYTSRYNI